MKFFALAALFTLSLIPSAHAQTASADARAQILKGQLEGFLENQKAMAVKNGCRLDTKGQITMEKAGGYYAYTLPHVTYTDAKGIRSEIGMVAINAVPEGDEDWKISLALPTPISSFAASGAEQFKTDIGTQNASGVWNEKLGHFTSVDAKLGNVQLNDLVKQSTVTIGAFALSQSLVERDPEAYTGSARATLDNISVFESESSFRAVIPKVVLDTNLADRASKTAMTKEQVKNRQQARYPDFYNIFAMMFGAPERVTAKVTGLDAVNAQLQQSMLTAPAASRQDYLQAILGVSAVSGMGKPVPGDATTKSYDVVFGQNGNVTVNGTDFGSLMKSAPAAGGTIKGIPALR